MLKSVFLLKERLFLNRIAARSNTMMNNEKDWPAR